MGNTQLIFLTEIEGEEDEPVVVREARFVASLLEGMVHPAVTELDSKVGEGMAVLEVLGAALGDEARIRFQFTSKFTPFIHSISS